MLDFAPSFFAWLASTAIPAVIGLLIVTAAGTMVKARYLTAFAFGIFLWFFVDTIGGSAELDVNAGFTGGIDQVATVALFVVGILVFFSVDRDILSFSSTASPVQGAGGGWRHSLEIPLLVAIAVGIHGFGEGAAFGSTAVSTTGTSLLDAFGGVTAGVAYVLHKALEPMMIGACYVAYAKERPKTVLGWSRDIVLLGIVFTVPSLIGAATGYYISYDATYFFALGTGTSIYAALRLGVPLLQETAGSSRESAKTAIFLVAGFLCIYLAALFHS